MTMNRFAAVFVVVLLVAQACTSEANGQDLYLIIGQSNAAGRDTENISPDSLDSVTPQVTYFTDDARLIKARQPLNQYSSIRKRLNLQGVNLGLEFGKAMNKANGRKVSLVVNARGGTRIGEWGRGNATRYFDEAVDRVRNVESLTGARLKGILWHQGEGNVNSTDGTFTESYFNSLRTMIRDFRSELGNVPFLVGQIAHKQANLAFNTAIKTVDDSSFGESNVDWVTARGLETFDGTHFTAAATRELGLRYAKIMLQYVD